jgi:hypothetical protein
MAELMVDEQQLYDGQAPGIKIFKLAKAGTQEFGGVVWLIVH